MNNVEEIEEAYVTFEIAQLLKECGFNIPVVGAYRSFDNGYEFLLDDCYMSNSDLEEEWEEYQRNYISAPTIQMTIDWLARMHNLFITMEVDFSDGAYPMFDARVYNLATCKRYDIIQYDRYSYEEGYLKAIEYCLKNLVKPCSRKKKKS